MIWNVEPALICHIFTSVKLGKYHLEKKSSTSVMIINNNSWYEKPVYEVTINMVTPTFKPYPNMPQTYVRKIFFHK